MKRILFLDVDGVLNNTAWYEKMAEFWKTMPLRAPREERDLDPENMRQLAELLRRVPSIEIVISSSWRCGRTLNDMRDVLVRGEHMTAVPFARVRIIGMTPLLESRLRWEEIKTWRHLNGHTDADRFLALDDDTFDMLPLGHDFLHVHRQRGLTPEHVEKAVAHFKDPV